MVTRSVSDWAAASSSAADRTARRASVTSCSVRATLARDRRSDSASTMPTTVAATNAAASIQAAVDTPVTLETHCDQGCGEHDRGGREQAQPAFLGDDERVGVQATARSVAQFELSIDRSHLAPHEANVVRERPLREREEGGERGAEESRGAEVTRDGGVPADDREASPGEAEPEIRVEASAHE